MCSSPKGRKVLSKQPPEKPTFSSSNMARFTAIANAAEARRDEQREQQAESEKAALANITAKQTSKEPAGLKKWTSILFKEFSFFHRPHTH